MDGLNGGKRKDRAYRLADINIIRELEKLKKLLENRNYGEQLALWDLVCILIKYIGRLEKRIKELNPYDSIPVRRTMENGKQRRKNV